MKKSTITINVSLDEQKVPENITWNATDSTADVDRTAKALMLSFWDGTDKTALRMDLWTKEMMVDEMADFYYQTFMTMAETFGRATRQEALVQKMKEFAKDFYTQFKEEQLKENKA
ncbi:gliding motility protein GldC [Gynurincola endophyticus]|jgi:gliding motility-associated protein GldC|uniref:gliding motility protein GldC n=1 Tax=Gynurincola endophyticus TaxID=2479004 RepID=UPI000F8C7E1D|nr:gliding motility protein GldC [Gynurincola endophyticus]